MLESEAYAYVFSMRYDLRPKKRHKDTY